MTNAAMPVKGGPWLQTHRGLAWMADAPESYPYDVEEIAHALSNLCRFAGHTRGFYSVAQHSVLVAREVQERYEDRTMLRAALLHDAAEAFCIDLPQPIKALPEMQGYRNLIKRTEYAIAAHFGLDAFVRSDGIKRADLVLLATEKRDLLCRSDFDAFWAGLPPAREQVIQLWSPAEAVTMFMCAWREFADVQRTTSALNTEKKT